MTYGIAFPGFFDEERLLNPKSLPVSFVLATDIVREIRRIGLDICLHEKYFPASLVIERYFMDKAKNLMGCQCVFFDILNPLDDSEKVELQSRTFSELVNSMDREVLLKIALVWSKGFNEEPELVLASPSMTNHQLEFLGGLLKTVVQLQLQNHPTNLPYEIGDI